MNNWSLRRSREKLAGSCCVLIAVLTGLFARGAAADGNSPHVDYMLHCQGCHLPGGVGYPGLVPNMQGHIGVFLRSEAGRAYLIQVPGAAQSDLDDAELAEVLNWMLSEFDPGNVKSDFKRFTGSEVTAYRATHLDDVGATRRALLAEQN